MAHTTALVAPCMPQIDARHIAVAMAAAGIGAWSWHGSQRRLQLSPEAWAVLGPSQAAWAGTALRLAQVLHALHPADRSGLRRALRRCLSQGQPLALDLRWRHPGGQVGWLAITAARLHADGGLPLLVGTLQDISDRRAALDGLARQAVRQRALIAQSKDGMLVLDHHGRVLDANPALAAMLGRPLAALPGLCAHDLGVLLPSSDMLAALRDTPGKRISFDVSVDLPDRPALALEVSASMVLADGQALVLASCQDITRRRHVEAELARHRQHLEAEVAERTQALQQAMRSRIESEHFLRSIADNIPDMVGYWDAQRVLRFANRPYRDWYAPGRDPLGCHRSALLGPPELDIGERCFAAALAGTAQHFEHGLVNAVGEVRYAWVHYIPDRQGDVVVGLFVLVSDLTEVRQAELRLQALNEQLVAARDRAEAANRAKSAFLANISHEIRTPMNAIIGLTHLMQRDAGPGLGAERLGKVSDAAHHLLDVINDVLDLSKIESGKLRLAQTDFLIDAVLSRACALVAERARDKGLELVLKSEGVPMLLRGDPTRLSQALLNLMSNAVKFSDRGSVVLRCELMDAAADALRLRFSVRDTGVGVPADKVGNLFNAFEQADTSTTRRFGGTGLGLAITRRLALLMGGDVGVHTVQGQGSCFWFTANFSRAAQASLSDSARLPGRRVLVADDLPEARAALADLLRRMGMQVDSVASGDEAVAAALLAEQRRRPYELLLLDAAMPGTGGVAAWRQLHQRFGDEATPPAVLISDGEPEAMPAGAAAHTAPVWLNKPITLSALSACIDRLDRQPWLQPLPDRCLAQPNERALLQRASGQRALLAEDNPVNQEVASELLRAVGMLVDVAADGHQAVCLAAGNDYDLVLMDMQMPVMDGLAATRALRAMPRHARTPILAMTASAFSDDRQACLNAGMDDHLAKPVDPELLYAMLGRWLPARVDDAPPCPPTAPPATAARSSPTGAEADSTEAASTEAASTEADGPDFSGIAGLSMARSLLYLPGRNAVYARVLRRFADDYAHGLPGLRAALAAGDIAQAQRLLHAMRGACGAVGATALQARALALEQGLSAADAAQAGAALNAGLQQLAAAVHARLAPAHQ